MGLTWSRRRQKSVSDEAREDGHHWLAPSTHPPSSCPARMLDSPMPWDPAFRPVEGEARKKSDAVRMLCTQHST
jgi:hypothetical protein